MDQFEERNKLSSYFSTINRSVFNKLHKHYNAHCTYCKWNRCENRTNTKNYDDKRQPNWKLVSRNKFQYQSKDLPLIDGWSNRGKLLDYKRKD